MRGNAFTPVDVVGLSSGVASVSVSEDDACAVMVAGGVKCWGNGYYGQLGNGHTFGTSHPVDVVGLGQGVRAVSVGRGFACALATDGVSCWGDNSVGELGDGTETSHSVPAKVARGGFPGSTAISAGLGSACLVAEVGSVYCWGYNDEGLLGVGSTRPHVLRPTRVDGLAGISSLSASSETSTDGDSARCAVGRFRTWCWGDNTFGPLGDGTTTNRATPTPVVGLPGQASVVAVNNSHSCAVTRAGQVYCWGDNYYGKLGDGTTTSSLTPVRVVDLGA